MLLPFRALPLSPFSFQRRFFAAAIFAAATLILLRYFRLPPLPYAFDDIISPDYFHYADYFLLRSITLSPAPLLRH
jgi:hypothetical protein